MADTIKMTLRAINWTEGDVGYVHLRMRPGECRVDWGDGRSEVIRATTEGWYNVHHAYRESCKETEELFHISITASGDGLITGFVAGSGEMMVADVDLSGCPALEYLKADWLIERLDVTTNPGIKEMNLGGDAASLVDLSCSRDLEKLEVRCSKLKKLKLSRCDSLEELTLQCNLELSHVSVSNRSSLKSLKLIDTSLLSEKCFEYLDRALERNGGTREEDSTSGLINFTPWN